MIEVRPLDLETSFRFFLLVAPHLSRLRYGLAAVLTGSPFAPGELTQAFALLVNREVEWVARNTTARELVEAIPVLDKVNDFKGLFEAMDGLLNGNR